MVWWYKIYCSYAIWIMMPSHLKIIITYQCLTFSYDCWLLLFEVVVLSYVSVTMETKVGLVFFIIHCLVRCSRDKRENKKKNSLIGLIMFFASVELEEDQRLWCCWAVVVGNSGYWIFNSCCQEHYVIDMFWEVIKSFSVENQKKFLKWVISLH